jgi:hemoglobin
LDVQISYGGEGRPQQTPYEAIGGAGTVARLVEAFYKRVAEHPDLAPIFPDDLGPVAKKQYAFLTQFFGGPPLFSQEYGPPMLRMRHLPHPITPRRAEAWLECMAGALDEAGVKGPVRDFLWQRLSRTAYHMVNTESRGEPADR